MVEEAACVSGGEQVAAVSTRSAADVSLTVAPVPQSHEIIVAALRGDLGVMYSCLAHLTPLMNTFDASRWDYLRVVEVNLVNDSFITASHIKSV